MPQARSASPTGPRWCGWSPRLSSAERGAAVGGGSCCSDRGLVQGLEDGGLLLPQLLDIPPVPGPGPVGGVNARLPARVCGHLWRRCLTVHKLVSTAATDAHAVTAPEVGHVAHPAGCASTPPGAGPPCGPRGRW